MARRPISSISKIYTSENPGPQSAKDNPSRGIRKGRKLSTVRRSARLQARSSPTGLPILFECLQNPSVRPKDLADAHARQARLRERFHDPENEYFDNERQEKGRRISPPAAFEQIRGGRVRKPLSVHNLRTHSRLLAKYLDDEHSPKGCMDAASIPSVPPERNRGKRKTTDGGLSRTASQCSTNPVTDSVICRKPAITRSCYRWPILESAGIYIRSRPPPAGIQKQINAILEKASSERKKSLHSIGKKLCDDFAVVLDTAAGEDDCIQLLCMALSSMDELERLAIARKAEWRASLKPRQSPFLDLSFVEPGSDDPAVLMNTPRLADANYPSPHISGSASIETIRATDTALRNEDIPPPPSSQAGLQEEPEKDRSLVQTPRPNVTVGIRNAVLVQKLQGHDLTSAAAGRVLLNLQQQMTYRNGHHEPFLCSEPTSRSLRIRFPFLVVEGKSYATGQTIFEAQNQAAVSGACALKILYDLADLTHHADGDDNYSGSHAKEANPLVFSICTEGPSHELWAHYSTLEDGVRMFNMSIMKIWHASLESEVLNFLTAVDNVISWGSGDFLDDIVERLRKVAKHAGGAREARA